ncbi:hypothetical protein ABWL39_20735 [Chitinivorax sp. PXF-14]|uniref:hypothetical protein n=1 Tax=Chitinivorax sp. PXF-14 TaxID=3230488 RepID=UPI0034652F32
MSEAYLPGEVVRISLTVQDSGGVAVDPGTVRLLLKQPAGSVLTLLYGGSADIIRDAIGRYHADVLLSTAGLWVWRWELDAPNAGAAEGTLAVQTSRMG